MLIQDNRSPPVGFQLLAPGATIAVRPLWLEEVLSSIDTSSSRRNKRAEKLGKPIKMNHSAEIIKKLMDGFFDPEELGINGGTAAFKVNYIYKSIKRKFDFYLVFISFLMFIDQKQKMCSNDIL
ncbi:hypothetical protein DPMN_006316 [Dreissena polymorpha]|uniref:Uncharacterized protein n=1 Tax=Dreissena polymorpha TaxID=45954 RepID=A0A9D4MS64_DREPO|nr:hypothetical protein DPMN_006316 [Dreissena polymorpha]